MLDNGAVYNNVKTPAKIQRRITDLTLDLPDVVVTDEILQIFPDQEDAEKMFYMT
jgi:hypothetical protein